MSIPTSPTGQPANVEQPKGWFWNSTPAARKTSEGLSSTPDTMGSSSGSEPTDKPTWKEWFRSTRFCVRSLKIGEVICKGIVTAGKFIANIFLIAVGKEDLYECCPKEKTADNS